MKKVKLMFSVLAIALALGAAFATSSSALLITQIWRKANSGGVCSATTCLISGPNDCSAPGFMYFNNSSCLGSTVAPRKN